LRFDDLGGILEHGVGTIDLLQPSIRLGAQVGVVGEPIRMPHLHQLTVGRTHFFRRATIVKLKNPERFRACHRLRV